jgi:hypothetical protein
MVAKTPNLDKVDAKLAANMRTWAWLGDVRAAYATDLAAAVAAARADERRKCFDEAAELAQEYGIRYAGIGGQFAAGYTKAMSRFVAWAIGQRNDAAQPAPGKETP